MNSPPELVNVAVGPNSILSGWWNVSSRNVVGCSQIMDISEPWPWRNSVKCVYAEGMLEKLSYIKGLRFLTNARESLKTGGRIRVCTPSLEWVLSTHFTYPKESEQAIEQTWKVNRAFRGWDNQFLYTKALIQRTFEECGYIDIVFKTSGDSSTADFANLEPNSKWRVQNGYPNFWIVEAEKGALSRANLTLWEDEARLKFMKYVRDA